MIECYEINEYYNQLRVAFKEDNEHNNEDLTTMLNLMMSVKDCTSVEGDYNKLVAKHYKGYTEVIVPAFTMHSCSIIVLKGQIKYCDVILPTRTVKNIEYTALNSNDFRFEVLKGSEVLFEYLTLDDIELEDFEIE